MHYRESRHLNSHRGLCSQQVTTVRETAKYTPYLGSGEAVLSAPSSKFDSQFQSLENASGQLKPSSHSFAAVSEIIIDRAIPFNRRKHTVPESSSEQKNACEN